MDNKEKVNASWTIPKLKEYLQSNGLSTRGRKNDLLQRAQGHQNEGEKTVDAIADEGEETVDAIGVEVRAEETTEAKRKAVDEITGGTKNVTKYQKVDFNLEKVETDEGKNTTDSNEKNVIVATENDRTSLEGEKEQGDEFSKEEQSNGCTEVNPQNPENISDQKEGCKSIETAEPNDVANAENVVNLQHRSDQKGQSKSIETVKQNEVLIAENGNPNKIEMIQEFRSDDNLGKHEGTEDSGTADGTTLFLKKGIFEPEVLIVSVPEEVSIPSKDKESEKERKIRTDNLKEKKIKEIENEIERKKAFVESLKNNAMPLKIPNVTVKVKRENEEPKEIRKRMYRVRDDFKVAVTELEPSEIKETLLQLISEEQVDSYALHKHVQKLVETYGGERQQNETQSVAQRKYTQTTDVTIPSKLFKMFGIIVEEESISFPFSTLKSKINETALEGFRSRGIGKSTAAQQRINSQRTIEKWHKTGTSTKLVII